MTTFLLLLKYYVVSTLYFTKSSFLSVPQLLVDYNFEVLFTPLLFSNGSSNVFIDLKDENPLYQFLFQSLF